MKRQIKKHLKTTVMGVVALLAVGNVWAYYHAENALENKLKTAKYGGEQLVEKFTPDENWELGETVTKEAFVENTGNVPLIVRVKLDEKWERNNTAFITLNSLDGSGKFTKENFIAGSGQVNASDGATAGDGSVVAKKLGSDKWAYSEVDGYWYYNEILQPVGQAGAKTGLFLEHITLVAGADMGLMEEVKYYTSLKNIPDNDNITGDNSSGWEEFTGAVPSGSTYSRSVSNAKTGFAGYAQADYTLTLTYETYQATTEARAQAVSNTGGKWDASKTPVVS